MKVMHTEINAPNEKFNSCVEGRILSLFKYFISNKDKMNDLYMFLSECCLQFYKEVNRPSEDPWYFQSLRIFVENMDEISSNAGFEKMCQFIEEYGIKCGKVEFESKERTIEWIVKCFIGGAIPIVLIDQFFFPHSPKYCRQKESIHALLLIGMDSEKEEFFVLDSGNEMGKLHCISFEEISNATINIVYFMYKKKENCSNNMNQERREKERNWKKIKEYELISVKAREKFLTEIEEAQWSDDESNLLFQGFSITIKYKILPYLIKTKKMMLERERQSLHQEVVGLAEMWEGLSIIILKGIYRKRKESELNEFVMKLARREQKFANQILKLSEDE